MHKFDSIEAASKSLLFDVCASFNSILGDYAIVGGWVPLLAVSNDKLKHPGTRDVDVLLRGTDDLPRLATECLLNQGFIVSAKHEFQLFRIMEVRGKKFVFSVDLLHPKSLEKPEMFHDIMSLDVPDSYDPTGFRHVRSIAFGMSDIVFREKLWKEHSFKFKNDQISVPLLTAGGCILSKLESSMKTKRRRDVFDIFYILSGNTGEQAAQSVSTTIGNYPEFSEQLSKFLEWVQSNDSTQKNVEHFAPGFGDKAKSLILELLHNQNL